MIPDLSEKVLPLGIPTRASSSLKIRVWVYVASVTHLEIMSKNSFPAANQKKHTNTGSMSTFQAKVNS